jgi:hypothetical protein
LFCGFGFSFGWVTVLGLVLGLDSALVSVFDSGFGFSFGLDLD